MSSQSYEAIIVGGGIVGANCAVQLARAGYDEVLMLEADEPASKASGRAAGSLTIYSHERFGEEASRFGRTLYNEYESNNDELTLHHETSYSIAFTETGADYLRNEHKSSSFETTFLDAKQLGKRETTLGTEDVKGALRFRDSVYTDPKQLTLAAHAVAKEEGGTLEIAEARDFEAGREHVTVETADRTYEAPVVVVAAGAWTKRLLNCAGTDIALRPRTSQIAVLDTPEPVDIPMWKAPDFSVYGRPTPEGRILFGGGTTTPIPNLETFSKRARVPFLRQLVGNGSDIVPAIEDATLHDDWAGRVSATPDRYPYVGETEIDGLYVCCGFNGEGISNSPFAARLLADLVVDREPIVDPTPFDPTRFVGDEEFGINDAVEWWVDR